MRPVTRWQSDDGNEYGTEAECIAHEALDAKVAAIMAPLPKRPKLGDGQFFRHADTAPIIAARLALVELAGEMTDDVRPMLASGNPMLDYGLDKMMGERHGGEISCAWGRLVIIDRQGREWSRPYYALHPDRAVGEVTP